MNYFTVYIWQQADTIGQAASVVAIITGAFSLWTTLMNLATYADEYMKDVQERLRSVSKKIFPVLLISTIIAIFLPSSKSIAIIYLLPNIAESRVIQQDIPDLYDAAIKHLKEQLSKGVQ